MIKPIHTILQMGVFWRSRARYLEKFFCSTMATERMFPMWDLSNYQRSATCKGLRTLNWTCTSKVIIQLSKGLHFQEKSDIDQGFFIGRTGSHSMCGPLELGICECGPCSEKFAHPWSRSYLQYICILWFSSGPYLYFLLTFDSSVEYDPLKLDNQESTTSPSIMTFFSHILVLLMIKTDDTVDSSFQWYIIDTSWSRIFCVIQSQLRVCSLSLYMHGRLHVKHCLSTMVSIYPFQYLLIYLYSRDYVSIHNGSSLSAPIIGKYCGSPYPFSVISTVSTLFVMFKSDSTSTFRGFNASYELVREQLILALFWLFSLMLFLGSRSFPTDLGSWWFTSIFPE